jgi:hypothetical protein
MTAGGMSAALPSPMDGAALQGVLAGESRVC